MGFMTKFFFTTVLVSVFLVVVLDIDLIVARLPPQYKSLLPKSLMNFKSAIRNSNIMNQFSSKPAYDTNKVVVVIGGGLAGMSAAIEAYLGDSSVKVKLIEKEQRLGGNSAKASSGINGVGTVTQKMLGVTDDSIEKFIADTIKSGKGLSNLDLASKLVKDSNSAVSWLQTFFKLDLDVLAQLGGHSARRTHRRPDLPDGRPQPVGFGITSTLSKYIMNAIAEKNSRFEVILNSRVTKLIKDDANNVVGVFIKTTSDSAQEQVLEIKSDAVVLATGGFAGEGGISPPLLKKYAPDLVGLPSTNGNFATGDGVLLGEEIGAKLVDMDKVQVHPTGFVKLADPSNLTKFLAAEALRGEGGILINGLGKRFVNELDTRDAVTDSIVANCAISSKNPINIQSLAKAHIKPDQIKDSKLETSSTPP
ncbi:Fumarate reductase 2, partial [Smittium culicis]